MGWAPDIGGTYASDFALNDTCPGTSNLVDQYLDQSEIRSQLIYSTDGNISPVILSPAGIQAIKHMTAAIAENKYSWSGVSSEDEINAAYYEIIEYIEKIVRRDGRINSLAIVGARLLNELI